MLSMVNDDSVTPGGSLIDEIVREGAPRMLAAALKAEVDQYMAELAGETDEAGRRPRDAGDPQAEDRGHTGKTIEAFAKAYGAK